MSKTFSIDSSQVNTVTNKALFRLLKMCAIILAIYIPGRLLIDGKNTAIIIPGIAGFVVVMALVWFLSYRRIKTITAGLEIVTDESCIEYKAPMTPYKRINWDDMAYVEKRNGVLNYRGAMVRGVFLSRYSLITLPPIDTDHTEILPPTYFSVNLPTSFLCLYIPPFMYKSSTP